ncbi:MAG: universal stress protein [Deltaproteobacteria bacterium]|nr:universal stress protein [Deltaproteobacteria bacterium]
MKEIKKILFPTDFSEHNSRLLPWVKSLVQKYQAELFVLNVSSNLEFNFPFVYAPHLNLDEVSKQIQSYSTEMMDKFVKEHLSDLPGTTTEVLIGDPAKEILAYIKKHEIDLIVMATHGRTGFEHAVFGSVAERVIKSSHIPVFVVNPLHN